MAKTTKSPVSWEAQEYIQHEKNTNWYIGLIIITLLFIGLSIFLKWWTFTALVVVSAIALFLYVSRPPRKIKYTLNSNGLTEGDHTYNFSDYKSFGLLKDGDHYAIIIIPRKRFNPGITVFFPEDKGEEIVDLFGAHLPMTDVKLDMIDKLIRFLRI